MLKSNAEYGRNLKSNLKVWYTVWMSRRWGKKLAVIIYNFPIAQKITATNLIEPKMWPLCKQGVAESVDVGKWQDLWMARAIRGCWEMVGGPSVDPWMARHSQANGGCQAIHRWPGSTVEPEQSEAWLDCRNQAFCRRVATTAGQKERVWEYDKVIVACSMGVTIHVKGIWVNLCMVGEILIYQGGQSFFLFFFL